MIQVKYISGVVSGSLLLCIFSFMQKIYIGAPLAISGFIVPITFGGIVGLTITFMFFRISRLVEKLKKQNAFLELRIEESTKELRAKNKQLERMSRTDSLTSLANRRHFDHVIEKECARLTREQSSLSLIICDVDNFKLFNDTYGHQAGDECLKKVAFELKHLFLRKADSIFRYGGEEFAIILPNTSDSAAFHFAEKARQAIEDLKIANIKCDKKIVTMSFGVFSIDSDDDETSLFRLIQKADNNLYIAKSRGKNTVV